MSRQYQRGSVVWAQDPFRTGASPRPWLVVSDDTHPFAGQEYLCVLLTTTQRSAAIELTQGDWASGYPGQDSYCNPWVGMTLKSGAIQNKQGALQSGVVDTVATELARYAGVQVP